MQFIDTHAHLTFDGLIENVSDVVKRAEQSGVTKIVNIATKPDEFNKVLQISSSFANVFAGIGIHPHYAEKITDNDIDTLSGLASRDKVVALGEMGLDYHYDFSKHNAQKNLFRQQLEIAVETQKPVIIHSREAFDDTIEILNDFSGKLANVVFHCYSGNDEQTRLLLKKGYHISFTGIVTFKSAQEARDAAKIIPLDRMMIETDCPFMSPVPMRKQKINEPALVTHTARFIAELKGIDFEKFATETTKTAEKFFGI